MKRMSWIRSAVVLLGSATCLLAAPAAMTLTGVGTSGVWGGVYIGPYVGTVNGVVTGLICDDYIDESYIPESWSANVYTITQYASAMFGSRSNAVEGYQELAWLSQQLTSFKMGLPTPPGLPCGTNCAGYIQYAMWSIFDPAALAGFSGTDLSRINAWLSAAQTNYSSGDYSNVLFYTPIVGDTNYPITCGGHNCPSIPPQEFIVVRTPEPAAMMLLSLDLSAVGALVFFLRRRRTGAK